MASKNLPFAVEIDVSRVTMPDKLVLDADRVLKDFGNAVATRVRQEMRAGRTITGAALDLPPGWDLKASGKLLRSIRLVRPKSGGMYVGPDWLHRRSDVGRKARTNYGLHEVLSHAAKKLGHTLDIFGWKDRQKRAVILAEILQNVIDKAIDAQEIRLESSKTTTASSALLRGAGR